MIDDPTWVIGGLSWSQCVPLATLDLVCSGSGALDR